MSPVSAWLIYGTVFLCILLLVDGLSHLISARDADTVDRRIRRRLGDPAARASLLLPRRGAGAGEAGGPLDRLDRLIVRAGLAVAAKRFAAAMAVGAAALASVLCGVRGLPVLPGLALAGALAVGLPVLVLMYRSRRRLARFGEQLPDALEMIVRSLRAGHPIAAALRLVADRMPDPMGREIALVTDEMTYGLDLGEALEKLSRRIDLVDLRFMVVAIRIQHEAGGNLVEILSGLARLMRARARMVRKVAALSAEGRLSAVFLSAMPAIVAGGISAFNPNYFGSVRNDPLFPVGLAAGVGGLLIGIVVIWRMVRVRI